MSESFARMKWRWLDRAMHDGRLSPRARCVAYEIGRHINAVTGEAWPSQETMRGNLGFKHVNQVKKAVQELHAAGHLEISRNAKTRSNTYVPKFGAALRVVELPSSKVVHGTTGGPIDSTKYGPIGGTTGGPTWDQKRQIDGTTGGPLSSKDNTQTEKRVVVVADEVPNGDAVLQSIKNNLAKLLTPTVASAWFSKVEIEKMAGHELTLAVPTRFAAKWISDKFSNEVLSATFTAEPAIDTVLLTVPNDPTMAPVVLNIHASARAARGGAA